MPRRNRRHDRQHVRLRAPRPHSIARLKVGFHWTQRGLAASPNRGGTAGRLRAARRRRAAGSGAPRVHPCTGRTKYRRRRSHTRIAGGKVVHRAYLPRVRAEKVRSRVINLRGKMQPLCAALLARPRPYRQCLVSTAQRGARRCRRCTQCRHFGPDFSGLGLELSN